MSGSALRSTRALSADNPKQDTPPSKDSTPTDDTKHRLGRLQEKLRRLRQGKPPNVEKIRPISDPTRLADELELVGAKMHTLANEIRYGAIDDPQLYDQTMQYLQECYASLAHAVDDRPHWSRA